LDPDPDPLVICTDPGIRISTKMSRHGSPTLAGTLATQDVEELKPYEVALGPELLDQVENLLRDLDMPPVKVQNCNSYLLYHFGSGAARIRNDVSGSVSV
jgi:hypothetical protein